MGQTLPIPTHSTLHIVCCGGPLRLFLNTKKKTLDLCKLISISGFKDLAVAHVLHFVDSGAADVDMAEMHIELQTIVKDGIDFLSDLSPFEKVALSRSLCPNLTRPPTPLPLPLSSPLASLVSLASPPLRKLGYQKCS